MPGVLVMPLEGSQPAERPPLTAVQLDDWGLWQCVERGQLADLTLLISRQIGRVSGCRAGVRRSANDQAAAWS